MIKAKASGLSRSALSGLLRVPHAQGPPVGLSTFRSDGMEGQDPAFLPEAAPVL